MRMIAFCLFTLVYVASCRGTAREAEGDPPPDGPIFLGVVARDTLAAMDLTVKKCDAHRWDETRQDEMGWMAWEK